MFRGAAWFSPSVPRHVRRQWVKYGGKKAGRGRDGIRRRLWYCFCNGPDDPKLPDVRSRGLVPYHALWIAESVKLGRVLSMQDYIIDEPLRPGLDTILRSPKRKPRALTFNPSISSSPYTIGTISDDQDSSILDFTYQDGDTTIDSGDFDESFGSPSRLLDFRKDRENSSSLSWDVTPSLTYEFNDEEMDKSQVEMLIDTEELPTAKNSSDWSEMTPEGSYPTNQPPATLELDASAVLSSLSSLYPRALASSTRFIPNVEYGGKTFTAIRKSELKRT